MPFDHWTLGLLFALLTVLAALVTSEGKIKHQLKTRKRRRKPVA
jgi:hypothetical protein